VDDRIVPGRYDLAVERLRRIPVGRDVALRALKDHQRLVALGQILPMRVGAREMAFDHPVCAFVLEHGRQVGGIKAA
jgi:hypothetical protein